MRNGLQGEVGDSAPLRLDPRLSGFFEKYDLLAFRRILSQLKRVSR